jgi:hypothetical protein
MASIGEKLLIASLSHFKAKKDDAEAKLTVYLSNPVGVGEHEKITDVVNQLIGDIEHANGCLNVVEGVLLNSATGEADATPDS